MWSEELRRVGLEGQQLAQFSTARLYEEVCRMDPGLIGLEGFSPCGKGSKTRTRR